MSQDSFPELPQMTEVTAQIPAKALVDMITQTIFAISAEESRFTLNGALLTIKPDLLVLVATDGHRLALVERPAESNVAAPVRALVPRKALQEILKIFGESPEDARIEFGATENHLFFQLGKRLLLSRKLTGNFPDYERVLPKDHPHALILSRDELRSTIERVSQFSDERTRAVKFKLAPGELIIHSSLSETGESEETIPAGYDGSAQEIGFNAQYILEFLRVDPSNEVHFLFKDASNAGELRPGGGDLNYNYRYIIMPMRI
jgi:DNA polymerase-3 subunit beta